MAIEIERRFLVKNDSWRTAILESHSLIQGYLSTEKGKTVRVRCSGHHAWLTIKGLAKDSSFARPEFEYAIPEEDARELINLCGTQVLSKTRHLVRYAGNLWEIDEFHEANAGLILAEIELSSETDAFELPSWIGAEITQDARYSNSRLTLHPWSTWQTQTSTLHVEGT